MAKRFLPIIALAILASCNSKKIHLPFQLTIRSADDTDTTKVHPDSLKIVSLIEASPTALKQEIGKGEQVKMIVIWASWCKYCKVLLQELPELKQTYNQGNLKIITLSADRQTNIEEARKKLFRAGNFNDNFIMSEESGDLDYLNNSGRTSYLSNFTPNYEKMPGLPFVLFIDSHGKVIREFLGYNKEERQHLISCLDSLARKNELANK